MASWLVAKLPGGEMTGYRNFGMIIRSLDVRIVNVFVFIAI